MTAVLICNTSPTLIKHYALSTISKPYRNTLVRETLPYLSQQVTTRSYTQIRLCCLTMCFYMANSLRAGFEPACGVYFHWPHNGPMSTIPSPRVPEVNYSPAWMLPADSIYHIGTHCPPPKGPCRRLSLRNNVFVYGSSLLQPARSGVGLVELTTELNYHIKVHLLELNQ